MLLIQVNGGLRRATFVDTRVHDPQEAGKTGTSRSVGTSPVYAARENPLSFEPMNPFIKPGHIGIAFAMSLALGGCAPTALHANSASNCHAALSATVETNAEAEKATATFFAVVQPLLTDPSGDFDTAVAPGHEAAARYRAESAAFKNLSAAVPSRYSGAAKMVSNSYRAVASATDAFASAAGAYAKDRSGVSERDLQAAVLAEKSALADNKAARDAASKLPGGLSVCD